MTNVDNMIKKMLGKAKSAQTSTSKFGVTNMFPNTTTAIKNSPIVKDIRRGYNKASKPLFKMANPNKILGGASIAKQKQWAKFSTPQRATLRRKYKDSDGDGVPNRWDCQPHNKFKQDEAPFYRRVIQDGDVGNCEMCGKKRKLYDDLCTECRSNKQDSDGSKIGTCELCGKENVKIWPMNGGIDWRCNECIEETEYPGGIY